VNLEALRFWRYIHRYLLGLVVLIELIWILYGKPLPYWKPDQVATSLKGLGAGEGILLVTALLLAGIIGGTFCELLIGFMEVLRSVLANLRRKPWIQGKPKLLALLPRRLVLPVEDLSVAVLLESLDFFLEHLSLYHAGSSGPENIGMVKEHEEEHLDRVRKILVQPLNPALRTGTTYAFQVTQERREIDNQRLEEEIVASALFASVLALILAFKFVEPSAFLALLVIGFLCVWGGIVRIARLRFRLASYMATLIMMTYALTEAADVVDRDAS
jgi:hypothetical protein